MIVAAIDPGLDGAYAIRTPESTWCHPIDNGLPYDPAGIAFDLESCGVTRVLIEDIESFPGKSSMSATITSAKNWGRLYEAIRAQGIGIVTVRSSEWKRGMKLSDSKATSKQKKDRAIALAKELYPSANLKRSEKCKNDHDGMCEALLILEWGIRTGVLK